MAAKIYTDNGYTSRSETGIASNSLAVVSGTLVSLSGGFVVASSDTVKKIIGISNGTKTFASDNQTVAKAPVSYTTTDKGTYLVIAADAILAQTDEGKFFDLTAGQLVNVASGTTVASYVDTSDAGGAVDPVLTHSVKLVKFVSQTASIFEVL